MVFKQTQKTREQIKHERMLGILMQMKKIGKYGNVQHDGQLDS